MSVWGKVSAQFGNPTGIPGAIAGMIMAKRGSNLERIDWAISLLDLHPTDRVLEIGFGPGIALRKLSDIVTEGSILGIDHSAVMVRQATVRNRDAIAEKRVTIHHGSISLIPAMGMQVDKVLDINSFQFWRSAVEDLKTIKAAMAPDGIIALVHQPRRPGSTDAESDQAGRRFAAYLAEAGFRDILMKKRHMKPVSTICALGRS